MDKHSSLLQKLVNYGENFFITLVPEFQGGKTGGCPRISQVRPFRFCQGQI